MRKIIIIAISCCTALLLLGYTGYRGYQAWKEKNAFNKAKVATVGAEKQIWLRQVLRLNPRNLEASRMMADLNEAVHSPAAIMWRERVLELSPDSLDDRLALAKTALLIGKIPEATNALAGVGASGRSKLSYQNLAGMIALASGNRDAATVHFVEASRLEPWNEAPQINLALVRLAGTNPLDTAEARITLTRISLNSTNGDLRCLTLRALVDDARRNKQPDSALSFSKQLVSQTNSGFSDRIQRLDILRETKQSEFGPLLGALQREASDDEGKVVQLARWQMARLGPADALNWLSSLPAETRTNNLVAWAMADCRVLKRDWSGLQSSLGNQNWDYLDFLRHAFLSRALREQGLANPAKVEWVHALQTASNQRTRLAELLKFTVAAKWASESEEILWKIVNQYPDDPVAVQGLATVLYENGRTPLLLNLFTIQSKRKPNDLSAKNNLAMTALLLNAQDLKPHDLAKEVYQAASTNSAFASTYAFSLHLQKKDAEALKIMQKLPPKDLENPSIAGYYGLILNATGDSAKAATYLSWAFKGNLLPEEKKLFGKGG